MTIAAPLAPLYLSGSVHRWHQNPAMAWTGQTNADHQGRCVILLLALHPSPGPSPALIRALATHDVGEMVAGDLSRDFKIGWPEVAERHRAAEDQARQGIFASDWYLTADEKAWLHLIDALEAHAWCLHRAPQEHAREAAGWQRAEAVLFDRADGLGVGQKVRDFIADLKGGAW